MGARSRRKGRRWEQDVVRLLKPIFGPDVKRGLAQSRFGASEAPDAAGVPRWWVECKHGHLVNLRAALEQARDALNASTKMPGDTRRPVAFCKDDRSKPIAVLYLDDFLALLSEWWLGQRSAHAGCEVEAQSGLHVSTVPEAPNGDPGAGSQALQERRRE